MGTGARFQLSRTESTESLLKYEIDAGVLARVSLEYSIIDVSEVHKKQNSVYPNSEYWSTDY